MKLAPSLEDFWKTYIKSGVYSRFFIGFVCGVPFLLTLRILDIWLEECKVPDSLIGLFTLCHLPFTLKFLWGPFIDRVKIPFFSNLLGQRRSWALLSQLILFLGLIGMSNSSPQTSLSQLMLFASMVAFAEGCQDVALYAYQVEKTSSDMFGPVAGFVVFGYRIGLLFAKSVSLYLASYYGWGAAYKVMALCVLFSTFVFLFSAKEPALNLSSEGKTIAKLMNLYWYKDKKLTSWELIKASVFECLVYPLRIFMKKKYWLHLIGILMLFRAGDRMFQKMASPFYIAAGFSKIEIANVVQIFGTLASLIGGVLGGYVVKRFGIKRAMFYMGVLHACSCLIYVILSKAGHNLNVLYFSVFIENTTCGAMSTAFLAFLYTLCYTGYPATQYALLWALHEAGGVTGSVISGFIVEAIGWTSFFYFVPVVFVPSLVLLYVMIQKKDDDLLT